MDTLGAALKKVNFASLAGIVYSPKSQKHPLFQAVCDDDADDIRKYYQRYRDTVGSTNSDPAEGGIPAASVRIGVDVRVFVLSWDLTWMVV